MFKTSNAITVETEKGMLLVFRVHRAMEKAAFSVQNGIGLQAQLEPHGELSILEFRVLQNPGFLSDLISECSSKAQACRLPRRCLPLFFDHMTDTENFHF